MLIAVSANPGTEVVFGWVSFCFIVIAVIMMWWIIEMCENPEDGTNKYGPDPRTTPR